MHAQFCAAFIELLAAGVISGYAVGALALLLSSDRHERIHRARLRIGEGVLLGLSYKMAATLLKALALHSWNQIGLFATVLALRTILKHLFIWEKRELLKGDSID
jgi:uncharacterized membrane protein